MTNIQFYPSIGRIKISENQVKTEIKNTNTNKEIKNGNKKLKIALAGLATLGTVATIGIMAFKGKSSKLCDIDFVKGIASKKDGSKFTGVIKDTLKNGDAISLKYKDGELVESIRKGAKNFEIKDGQKLVKTTTTDDTTVSNVTELIQKSNRKAETILTERIEQPQKLYNKPFNEILFNKNAEESASVFEEKFAGDIKTEAKKKIQSEQEALRKIENSQKAYKLKFKKNLSNKPAKESASYFFTKNGKRPIYDDNGNIEKIVSQNKPNANVKEYIWDDPWEAVTTKITKKNLVTEEYFDNNGNITRRLTGYGYRDGKELENVQTETQYIGNIKRVKTQSLTDSKKTEKEYIKDKGKHKLIYREIQDDDSYKLVEHLPNGLSKTTIKDNDDNISIIFRDKKGKIIDIQEFSNKSSDSSIPTNLSSSPKPPKPSIGPLDAGAERIYERWYINYAKLCKKLGIQMRPCGVTGGAWAHFLELSMEPKDWNQYLKVENYRAQYNPKAKLMQFLRELDSNQELNFLENYSNLLMSLDDESILQILSLEDKSEIIKLLEEMKNEACCNSTETLYNNRNIIRKAIGYYNDVYSNVSKACHETYEEMKHYVQENFVFA